MLEHYQRHAKAGKYHAELENRFIDNQYRIICFTSSLLRKVYHFATDFNHVLLQLVGTDIINTLFKYKESYRHLTFIIKTFKLLTKSCSRFDMLFVKIHVQMHVYLKSKFYSLNCCIC